MAVGALSATLHRYSHISPHKIGLKPRNWENILRVRHWDSIEGRVNKISVRNCYGCLSELKCCHFWHVISQRKRLYKSGVKYSRWGNRQHYYGGQPAHKSAGVTRAQSLKAAYNWSHFNKHKRGGIFDLLSSRALVWALSSLLETISK